MRGVTKKLSFTEIGRIDVTTCMSMSKRYKTGLHGYIFVQENQGNNDETRDGSKLEMSEADIGHTKLAGMLSAG